MTGMSISPGSLAARPLGSCPEGATLLLDFVSGRAIDQGVVSTIEQALVCDRADSGMILGADGQFLRFGVNEVRRSARGLLVEEARSNYLLESFNPATQTVSLSAGNHVVWMAGDGSVTLSGAASGVAIAGAPLPFTLGVADQVTVTPSGAVTFFQLEKGGFPTSPIETGGTTKTRAVDNVAFADASWLDPQSCTLLIEWEQVAPATGVQTLMRWQNLSYSRLRSGGVALAQVRDGADNLVLNEGVGLPPPSGVHRLVTALSPDDMAVAGSASISGTPSLSTDQSGTPEAAPTLVRLGSNTGGEPLNGWLRRLVYWPVRLADADLVEIAAGDVGL